MLIIFVAVDEEDGFVLNWLVVVGFRQRLLIVFHATFHVRRRLRTTLLIDHHLRLCLLLPVTLLQTVCLK